MELFKPVVGKNDCANLLVLPFQGFNVQVSVRKVASNGGWCVQFDSQYGSGNSLAG